MWDTGRGRRIAVAAVLASTVPLNAVYFFHAYGDGTAFTVTDGERAAYEWIARETPSDAIFLEQDDIVRVPVLAGRDQYWGTETYAFNWGYDVDEIARRRAVRDSVFGASGAGEEVVAALRALGRRVYVVCREKQSDTGGSGERFAGNARYVLRFAAPDITVFELLID
jgi:hypothetical protein